MEKGSQSAGRFKAAYAATDKDESDWGQVAKAALDALGELPEGANLGFLYATDLLGEDLTSILTFLRQKTGVENWVGTVGLGIVANAVEFYDRPAISLLVGSYPEEKFRIFSCLSDTLSDFRSQHGEWVSEQQPILSVVHADPRHQGIIELIEELSEETSSFLVGGLTSSRLAFPQIAGDITEGRLSGVLFSSDQLVLAALTQGCSPIGPLRQVTAGEGNVVMTIDDRPAIEVLKEDIGELLARDLRRIGGYIYVSFPIAASDTGDYLVRNIVAIDETRGWLQVGDNVSAGMALRFCRRDNESAAQDLRRMLEKTAERAGTAPRAGLYFSCIARGRHLFGPDGEEMQQIRKVLGDIPITGFFANGEISNNRLYSYTGVLALLF